MSSVINFAIEPETCIWSSNFTHAKPPAPNSSFAKSTIPSKNFLDCSAQFGTIIAFTSFPLKPLNSEFSKHSVTLFITSGFLKSGLSEPYFSIASLYGILTNGASSISQVVCALNTFGITTSRTLNTSSCVAKLISKSN